MGRVSTASSTSTEPSTNPAESSGCHQRERGVRSSCGYSAPMIGRSRRRPGGVGAAAGAGGHEAGEGGVDAVVTRPD